MAKQNSIKIGQQNQAYIMKNVKQRLNSNQKEHQDDTDGSVNYESLKEDLPGEDLDEVTDTEFYNPVFKPRPVYNSNLGVVEDYDKLNFTPRTTPKASPNSIRKNQGEADKQIEEIEMMGVKNGVNNYGYIHDRNRPNSWESDLSAINPVSTAIRNPVNIPPRRVPSVGMEMSESPPRDYANSISKQSAYSSVSDANPYLSSSDKDPQYEVLPRKDFNRQVVEQRQSGSKKINMLYESAVITEKSEKYRKRSVDEAASYDDSSNCCHLTFTILTGILAVVALVVVFLMVFGVIKCKDCDDSTVTPSTSAQAQGFEARLKILQDNLTQLKNEMHTNSSDVIVALRKELEEQKALVTSLNNALQTQKQLTDQLNATTYNVTENWPHILQGPEGDIGPMGVNGSIGETGGAGVGLMSSTCTYKTSSEEIDVTTDHSTAFLPVIVQIQANEAPIGMFCSSGTALKKTVVSSTSSFTCTCRAISSSSSKIDCSLTVFYCPVAFS